MKKYVFLAPTGHGVGLTSICVGLIRAFDRVGARVSFCKPIAQHSSSTNIAEPSSYFVDAIYGGASKMSISIEAAKQALIDGEDDELMEQVVNVCYDSSLDSDLVIVEGLVPQDNMPFIVRLNSQMATTLDSDVILVGAQNDASEKEFNEQINMATRFFGGVKSEKVLGCILNKVGAPKKLQRAILTEEESIFDSNDTLLTPESDLPIFKKNPNNFKCLGKVMWNPTLMAPRVLDVAEHLSATIMNDKADTGRRVLSATICARTIPNMVSSLKAGALVVTPGDRDDILLAACMAVLKGVPLAGILLTGNYQPSEPIMALCQKALDTGVPLLITPGNTIRTARYLDSLSADVPPDDLPRIEQVMNAVAESIDIDWLLQRAQVHRSPQLSPAAFRHSLVTRASEKNKRIVLPEGEEPRTIQAAIMCHEKKIARCVLLGDSQKIHDVAEGLSLTLPHDIEIIDHKKVAKNYVEKVVELRKHKGLTAPMAESMLEESVVVGTVMLALGEVDGLVSGAVHTTANTIRPALQFIKTHPNSKIVSSVFFMCLPEQVVVYGDCAVNPDPSAEELADIAIQSGDSAKAMGIEPRIAMISYSTGDSGIGRDVDKVREATHIAKQKRPDLLIEGPLQYDAASVAAVAEKKAPNSKVAGKATVFVFPDLNTGNTTYKAVQRSANVVSIGPMLQGLRKPVNDLSRGALVEDIVYTIALTGIQAAE